MYRRIPKTVPVMVALERPFRFDVKKAYPKWELCKISSPKIDTNIL